MLSLLCAKVENDFSLLSRAALTVEEAEQRRFKRDMEQASTTLQALDKAIAELEGKTTIGSVERLIRLIELRQGLVGREQEQVTPQVVLGKGLKNELA